MGWSFTYLFFHPQFKCNTEFVHIFTFSLHYFSWICSLKLTFTWPFQLFSYKSCDWVPNPCDKRKLVKAPSHSTSVCYWPVLISKLTVAIKLYVIVLEDRWSPFGSLSHNSSNLRPLFKDHFLDTLNQCLGALESIIYTGKWRTVFSIPWNVLMIFITNVQSACLPYKALWLIAIKFILARVMWGVKHDTIYFFWLCAAQFSEFQFVFTLEN